MVLRAAPSHWPGGVNGCALRVSRSHQGRSCEGGKPKRSRKAALKRLCDS